MRPDLPLLSMSRCRPPGGAAPAPFPGWSLGLAAIAVIAGLDEGVSDLLQYDRVAIAAGEPWRAVTGHWMHWNVEHLVWDAAVFAVLGALCERLDRRAFLACVAGASLAVSAAVWIALPQMLHYRGLSGLDAALYVLAGGLLLRQMRSSGDTPGIVVALLAASALCAKIGYEALTGLTIFVRDAREFVPVPLAHAAGAAVGALSVLAAQAGPAAESSPPPGRPRQRVRSGGRRSGTRRFSTFPAFWSAET